MTIAHRARLPDPAGPAPLGAGPLRSVASGVGRASAVARAACEVVRTGLRTATSPTVLAGVVAEGAWVTAHVLTYPGGLLADRDRDSRHGYRIEHLPPVQRGLLVSDVEAAGTPILLVHGMVDNRSVFTVMRRGLQRRGFGQVMTMNYPPLAGDVRSIAARLGQQVQRLVEETGYERVHIVGHSLGGLAARYYATRLGGDEHVHTVVTLGTPHEGTVVAYGWPGRLSRQLRPGSGLMQELARPAPGCRTRFLAYWSDLDEMVLPHRNAALTHPDLDVTNVALHAVGHLSLPVVGAVVHGIATRLAQLDTAGRTVVPGVTPLALP